LTLIGAPGGAHQVTFHAPDGRPRTLCFMSTGRCAPDEEPEGEFIIAAREALLLLIAEVERLRTLTEALNFQIESCD
jgi:hypothetical protein